MSNVKGDTDRDDVERGEEFVGVGGGVVEQFFRQFNLLVHYRAGRLPGLPKTRRFLEVEKLLKQRLAYLTYRTALNRFS